MTVILFDVDGVLIHGYHEKEEFRKCWDENLEIDFGISRDEFAKHFIQGVFVEKVLIGEMGLYAALSDTLPQIGYTKNPQKLIDYWMEQDSHINSELMRYIARLSELKDVSLFIATNQEKIRAKYLMHNLGLGRYFIDIFNSGRLGIMKPNQKFYSKVQSLLPTANKEDVIFFDDHQSVVDSAIKFGWEAHQFNTAEDIFKSNRIRLLL